MNKYAELRQRQQQETNALPIGFAFGNRQFEEMMRGWGLDPEKDLDKIYRLGSTGGYYKKTDAQLIRDTLNRHETELQEAIEALTGGKTIIMIAHRLRTVVDADQIFVLENGKLVERGTHDELIAHKGLYEKLYHIQQESLDWVV